MRSISKALSVPGHLLTLIALVLLVPWHASASTTVSVAFFLDDSCTRASTLNPRVPLPLNQCINTPGMVGFVADNIACASGNLRIYSYEDNSCAGFNFWDESGMCAGQGTGASTAAIILVCGSIAGQAITATSIVSIADVVTQAPASGTSTRVPAGSITTGNAQATQGSGSSTGSTGADVGFDGIRSGWNSLTDAERIGIIVSLAMGIPAIILAALGVWCMVRRR